MKIALFHETTWPHVGGVETLIRDQATLLTKYSHEVTLITGSGDNPDDSYTVMVIPEIALDYPLNVEVRAVLNRGQMDQKFNQYRSLLVTTLRTCFEPFDCVIVHNVFTMHFNLALTQALHDLSGEFKLVAWTNDLVATNSDYSLPNPTKSPWNLMRTAAPAVTYVAVSEARQKEVVANLKPTVSCQIIPAIFDLARHLNLTPEIRASLDSLNLSKRDYIFFFPAARITPRKNIEFAIELIKEIKARGFRPLLLITGVSDDQNSSSIEYGQYLRTCIVESLKQNIVFVHDYFPAGEQVIRDLYMLSDCLLFPAREEGFGMPIVEAALNRLPIWCNQVPAFWEFQGEGMYMIKEISQLSDALSWLESLPSFRLQRLVRRTFDNAFIYEKSYLPLLNSLEKKRSI